MPDLVLRLQGHREVLRRHYQKPEERRPVHKEALRDLKQEKQLLVTCDLHFREGKLLQLQPHQPLPMGHLRYRIHEDKVGLLLLNGVERVRSPQSEPEQQLRRFKYYMYMNI